MENRRDFIKKAALLTGSMGLFAAVPESIKAALAIDPMAGSTYFDAEHVVLLMQENRSFDHSFGTLRGVRGFDDPRAIRLPNNNRVWLQSDKDGNTFGPFRLDLQDSNAAWTGDLPHSWENQMGARNKGLHDNWLEAKRSGSKKYKDIPLTMGHYTRSDIPFYYALADAFTICDQHFCSSITGTTTNRHFFWTGTCVPAKGEKPLTRNSDTYYNKMAYWKTFPERLQENNIAWKIYQNEISLSTDLEGEANSWLANFTDNNLEWFAQYNVNAKKSHIDFLHKRIDELPAEIAALEQEISNKAASEVQKQQNALKNKRNQLASYKEKVAAIAANPMDGWSDFERELHQRAFQTNEGDPSYHEIEQVEVEGGTITVPKGDVLYQFRKDVEEGNLPTVSWLVAPQNFSDHPSAPMYGAWYVSEILNILTKNPEIWKKTIFIINYDENDGYFDHVPPFVAPKPGDPSTGKASPSLDYSAEYVTREQELASGVEERWATEGPVGLGYRVPLIIASPWSKGGWVNSEVCDITSTIQFMESWLNKKFGTAIREDNISSWRRAITGNLASAFRRGKQLDTEGLEFLDQKEQVALINASRDLMPPNKFHLFSKADLELANSAPMKSPYLPKQEKGSKPSSGLSYELYVAETRRKGAINLDFIASADSFGEEAVGAPFLVYNRKEYLSKFQTWNFAAAAGESVAFDWQLDGFENSAYKLNVHGPNGFLRGFEGSDRDSDILVHCRYEKNRRNLPTGNLRIVLENHQAKESVDFVVESLNYQQLKKEIRVRPGEKKELTLVNKGSQGWYDIAVRVREEETYLRRFAGHVDTGQPSMTDPLIGRDR